MFSQRKKKDTVICRVTRGPIQKKRKERHLTPTSTTTTPVLSLHSGVCSLWTLFWLLYNTLSLCLSLTLSDSLFYFYIIIFVSLDFAFRSTKYANSFYFTQKQIQLLPLPLITLLLPFLQPRPLLISIPQKPKTIKKFQLWALKLNPRSDPNNAPAPAPPRLHSGHHQVAQQGNFIAFPMAFPFPFPHTKNKINLINYFFCFVLLKFDENLEQWPHLNELVQCYTADWVKDDNKYGHYDTIGTPSFSNQIYEGPDTDIETGILFIYFLNLWYLNFCVRYLLKCYSKK